jgi:ribonuclease Y
MTFLLVVLGASFGAFLYKIYLTISKRSVDDLARQIIKNAENEARRTREESESAALLTKQAIHSEHRQKEEKLERERKELIQKQAAVEKAEKALLQRRIELQHQEQKALLSPEEAKALVLKEAETACSNLVMAIQQKATREADTKALNTLVTAMQRLPQKALQASFCEIALTSIDVKAKIIGRDGKNIKAFEQLTGVQLILDDSEKVLISCFDPKRRELAKSTLSFLLQDGRINPERIQSAYKQAQDCFEETIFQYGKKACDQCNVVGLHPELIKLLGSMQLYRSYSQNLLDHSIEVSMLLGSIAAELSLDEKLARRIGLLHDIGKVLSTTEGATHALAGAACAQKYGESEIVVNGIACHHAEVAATSLEGALCAPADAISAARPGARLEPRKDLKVLEEAACEFPGVIKAYALSGGKELQVFIRADITDEKAHSQLAKDITLKLQKMQGGAATIAVTIIRPEHVVQYLSD